MSEEWKLETCRNRRRAAGQPYPRSSCTECGSLLRPGWKCPHETDRRPTETPASGEREGEEAELSEKDLAMIDWGWETHKAAAPAPSPPSQASEIEARLKALAEGADEEDRKTVYAAAAFIRQQAGEIERLKETLVLAERQTALQTTRLFAAEARVKELAEALERNACKDQMCKAQGCQRPVEDQDDSCAACAVLRKEG